MESVNDSWKVDLVHHYVALVLSGSIGVDQFNNPVDLKCLVLDVFVCSNGYHLFTKTLCMWSYIRWDTLVPRAPVTVHVRTCRETIHVYT